VFDDGKWMKMHPTVNMAGNQAAKELRALLRVARAAKHLSRYAPTERWVELSRAQASLDRASGGGK
jgi:hypothetical protein